MVIFIVIVVVIVIVDVPPTWQRISEAPASVGLGWRNFLSQAAGG